MKKKKPKTNFVHIGGVIDDVLSEYRNKYDLELIQVWRLWDGVVGEAIAKNAQPAAFKGKLLLVYVTNSTWLHQLQFLKGDILSRLNDALAKTKVEGIIFKIGSIP